MSSRHTDVAPAATRPEVELLLCCARADLTPTAPRIAELLEGDIDWTYLMETALAHGVDPLLVRALAGLGPDRLPPELLSACRSHATRTEKKGRWLARELIALLEILDERGIEAIPFKGPTLAALTYGDLGLRTSHDIDLLVRPERLRDVCDILTERGFINVIEQNTGRAFTPAEDTVYREYQCEYALRRPSDGLMVEPHWAMAPKPLAISLDYDGFWQRARPVSFGEGEVLALSVEDLLLVLCVHGSKHYWTELRWICDVAELLGRHLELDAAEVVARAQACGCERILLIGLQLAHRLLDAPLAPSFRRRIAADRGARALTDWLVVRLFAPGNSAPRLLTLSWYHVRMRERFRDRVRYVVRTMTTATLEDLRRMRLPPALYALRPLAKLVHDHALRPFRRAARRIWGIRQRLAVDWPARRRAKRVLLIDWLPISSEGAGFPRMNAALRLLAGAGYRVTVYPVAPCSLTREELRAHLPAQVEVIRYWGMADLEGFLHRRWHQFGSIIASRPQPMATLGEILSRKPHFASRARVIYDAEALFALRDINGRRASGDPVDHATAAQWIAKEVALAAPADAVTVVSSFERELFQQHGRRGKVHVLPHAVRPAPTPRPFKERRGLLFVGRLAESGSPNTDGLLWFRDVIFPEVRRRLAEQGHDVRLTVAGKLGAVELADGPPEHMDLHGIVNDLTPLYDQARVFIAPTRFAAGIPLKVLEAAAHGVPVVATRLLASQLGWRTGEDLLASDIFNPTAFADNIVTLYTCRDLWERVRGNALSRVREECSPDRFLATLLEVLETPRN